MDFAGIDKIKINNAIVVFLTIINCLFFPLTILIEVDYKIILNNDLLKLASTALCIGCANFVTLYSAIAIIVLLPHGTSDLTKRNFLSQRPLLLTIVVITIAFLAQVYNLDSQKLVDVIKSVIRIESIMVGGMILGTIVDWLFAFFRRRYPK